MTSALLTAIAFALYLAAAVSYGAFLFLRAPAAPTAATAPALTLRLDSRGRPFLWLGLVAQFAAIGVWCVTTHRSPFASEFGTLAVSAWVIALAFAIVDFRARIPAVGAIALLVACLLLFWSIAHARGPIAETPVLKNNLVSLHVLLILVSFALFALAFGCAALYLVANRMLKARRVNGIIRLLPPLETLDSLAYRLVAYALPLLTLGLTLGILRTFGGGLSRPPKAWLLDAHTIASLVTWCLYVLYLVARLFLGWRGVRLQYVLIVGLFVSLALYFIPTNIHQFR
jgi:ABC-type transport system involved in cytochrome c biogenesis permease subunit